MLKLDTRCTDKGDYYNPPVYTSTIKADFEININELILEENIPLDEANDEILKNWVPCEGFINEMGWCDISMNNKILSLCQIWDMSLLDLMGQTITFLDTEN